MEKLRQQVKQVIKTNGPAPAPAKAKTPARLPATATATAAALALLGLLSLAPLLAGCSGLSIGADAAATAAAADAAAPPEVEAPLPVTVTAAGRRDLVKTLTLGGLLRPQEEATMMGGGTGSRVLRVNVEVGDRVRKGQLLLSQDMRDLAIQEETLQLNLTQLQDNYEKNLALFEAGAAAEAQLTALENQVRQLELQLETLRLAREKMAVTSTIDGIISALPVLEGQMAAASTPVAMVVNIDKLLLDVQVGENYIRGVRKGDELAVNIPALGGEPVPGLVKAVPPTITPQTRAYAVTIEIDNPELEIKGGMYGEIALEVEKIEQALVVPQYAILQMEDGPAVFVEENGLARRRGVEVGMTLGNDAEIRSGLSEGELIIVEGQYSVTEGRSLNVLNRGGGQ
ncbi:MAG: efflux RND transporter periplasmic adaptor subunit [Peptococcaceae bacterium]|jgi:RND family efflux transporter MFP subunit|nr:efflux RND transporter periplasmic adaptor subunit [Peptococcaceae bacterium]